MINKLRAIEYGIEIVFWILAFFYFLNNSFLRPVQNIGTECVILLMIAVVVYADKYLYTPLFLLRNRYLPYAFCLVFSVMAATVAEFAVVKPDIVAIFAPSLPEKALNDYLTGGFPQPFAAGFCLCLLLFPFSRLFPYHNTAAE